MVSAWNPNMKYNYAPSWVSTLDESMCAWLSKYTCPGWMVVPQKPHPYGNEYHTICCGKSGILYYVEIIKGKDCPRQMPPLQHNEKGKTAGLVLRMTE
jgi:Transposase IS4